MYAFTLQFSIYAEIKLNCVKLNNIEISIHILPPSHTIFRAHRYNCIIFERFMAYALNNFHSFTLMCGLNVRACDRSATYLRQHFSSFFSHFWLKNILFGGWWFFKYTLWNSGTHKFTWICKLCLFIFSKIFISFQVRNLFIL